MPGIKVTIPKGTPLAGFIPIPRYYADQFEIKSAVDIFTEDDIAHEHQQHNEFNRIRDLSNQKSQFDKLYFKGKDAFGVDFKDHQGP